MNEPSTPMIAFGPVPSRRFGRSLGINNIPPKACTYSCVYCQLGRTMQMQAERRAFYTPEEILQAVEDKIEQAARCGEAIDYLTLVPDGEPTLDIHLGRAITLLRTTGIKVAVITNASLVWHEDVQAALMQADRISLKIDCIKNEVWRRINRPHRSLQLPLIISGLCEFAGHYKRGLMTETMLIEGINDSEHVIRNIADFLARLKPVTAYLSIPHRPAAEKWVHPPGASTINRAYQIFSQKLDAVTCLTGYEGNAFAFTGDAQADLLGIASVHPMRESAVSEFLDKAHADWEMVYRLIEQGQLVKLDFEGQTFYMRKLG